LVIAVVSIIISHSSDKVFQVRVVGAFCKNIEEQKKTIPDIRKTSVKEKFYALANVIEMFTNMSSDSLCNN